MTPHRPLRSRSPRHSAEHLLATAWDQETRPARFRVLPSRSEERPGIARFFAAIDSLVVAEEGVSAAG